MQELKSLRLKRIKKVVTVVLGQILLQTDERCDLFSHAYPTLQVRQALQCDDKRDVQDKGVKGVARNRQSQFVEGYSRLDE